MQKYRPDEGVFIEMSMAWYVYILRCADNSLYTGMTNDLERRFVRHMEGKASKYTRSRGVMEMIYNERYPSKSKALKRECEIKALTRRQKLQMAGFATERGGGHASF